MQDAIQLAGFLGAEAMLQVSKGRQLSPLIIFEKADGTSRIMPVKAATPEKAAYKGEEMLRANADKAERGVMALDAFLNLPQGRSDAIFLQVWQYKPVLQMITLALPYRPAGKKGGFAIHRLKLIAFEDEPLPQADLVTAFFRGVAGHEKGSKFWEEHYEDSY